ncbi:hypothetical protein [Dactylosporangium sp. CA-092794]|uniref:hypothetical protein n=1 Tax=Dactylosporangium sp. CA-092794 TaxID=3239929 RepID=UPI003D8CA844
MREKLRWIGAVALVLIAVGAGVFVPAPAYAEPIPDENHYVMNFEQDAAEVINFCVKAASSDHYDCSNDLDVRQTSSFTIPYKQGDQILLDIYIKWGPTHKDYDITGGTGCSADYEPRCTQCTAWGTVQATTVDCHLPKVQLPPPPMPSVAPYADNSGGLLNLLNLLAWCVSACAVLGIIVVGTTMAIQLRRGDPGEMSEHWRGFATVIGGCVLGLSAGPLVQFLVPFI